MNNHAEDILKLKEEIAKIKADHKEEIDRIVASYEATISRLRAAAQDDIDFDLSTPPPAEEYNWLENPIVQGLAAGLVLNHIINKK